MTLPDRLAVAEPVERVVSIDSSNTRAHKHAAGATKIHAVVDAFSRPLAIRLTPGQAGDNPQLLPLNDPHV